ncbi:MAG: BtpA/SgcQ family protein [Bacteriovoracaceae bacterium]|jgi:uncharacterized protein|nr:BtpA/SgcQ family protein [Bacteriovoracaceae bacterium]
MVQGLLNKPIIGVIYLPPLLGHDGCPGMDSMISGTIQQVQQLEKLGYTAALLENENDRPYSLKARVEIVASMTRITSDVVKACPKIKIGVEFLINDPMASLAIAKASGASFIRTDYFVDRMSREEFGGEIEINASEILAFRKKIGAVDIDLYTDIQVKYAKLLTPGKTLAESAGEARKFSSSAVVVSGRITGEPIDVMELKSLHESGTDIPIFLGSGLNSENAVDLWPICDGAMVGTSIMTQGIIDRAKASVLIETICEIENSR